jgi:hypothetical protein
LTSPRFCRTRFWNQGKAYAPPWRRKPPFCRTRFWNQGKAKTGGGKLLQSFFIRRPKQYKSLCFSGSNFPPPVLIYLDSALGMKIQN